MTRDDVKLIDRVTTDYGSPILEVLAFKLAQARARSVKAQEDFIKAEEHLDSVEAELLRECREIEESEKALTK